MTLPLLLAAADIRDESSITVGLAWTLGTAIVLAVAAFVREHQKGVERDKEIATLKEQRTADALRIAALEVREARTQERIERIYELVTRLEGKVDRLLEINHATPNTRRTA